MTINFQIKAVEASKINHLMKLTNEELVSHNAKRITVDEDPGYPCRFSLVDAKIDETVIALNYTHHDVNSPYKASGTIFVRENAKMAELKINEVPKMLRHRLLSVRAYNSSKFMINAETAQGDKLETAINKLFQDCLLYTSPSPRDS